MARPDEKQPGQARSVVRLVAIGVLACLAACASGRTQGAGQRDGGAALENLSAPVLVERGRAHLSDGSYPLAEVHFAQALKVRPGFPEALTGLGETLLAQKKYAAAQATFGELLKADAGSRPALLGLGRVSQATGDRDAAMGYLSRARDLWPDDPEVVTELALAFESAGREEQAAPLFVRVTELRPRSASAYNNLGFNCLLRKSYPDAVSALERAVALAPADRKAQNNLAVAYGMAGEDAKALQLFEQTLGKAAALNNLGYIQMLRGDWQKAEGSLRGAIEASPTHYVRARENLDRLGQMVFESAKKNLESLKEGGNAPPASPKR